MGRLGSEEMELGSKGFKSGGWSRGGQRSWGVGVGGVWFELKSRRSMGLGLGKLGLGGGYGRLGSGIRGVGGGVGVGRVGKLGSGDWG